MTEADIEKILKHPATPFSVDLAVRLPQQQRSAVARDALG
jgi:hypothetical protein